MPARTPLNQHLSSSYALKPSTLEDIDYAVYNYINDNLNIYSETNKGFEKVPVIYSMPERAYQIKNDPDLRTDGRTLIYPMISLLRSGLVQDPTNKGIYGVNVLPYFDYYNQGGSITTLPTQTLSGGIELPPVTTRIFKHFHRRILTLFTKL